MATRTLKELEEACNAIAVELMGEVAPCRNMRRLADVGLSPEALTLSCVMQEEHRALTKTERDLGWARRPFSRYDHLRMCAPCASYWHASMARICLLDELQRVALVEALAPAVAKAAERASRRAENRLEAKLEAADAVDRGQDRERREDLADRDNF